MSGDKCTSYDRMDTRSYCVSVGILIEPWYVWMLPHDTRIALGRAMLGIVIVQTVPHRSTHYYSISQWVRAKPGIKKLILIFEKFLGGEGGVGGGKGVLLYSVVGITNISVTQFNLVDFFLFRCEQSQLLIQIFLN